ncbi:MAG: pyridoxal phosphate-dependent aminotransferase [Alphaproteobacteria bacterium]|nr:pyridoxal phosphate-dependent aminotransferase [Alphaproteobacteria bacterium]
MSILATYIHNIKPSATLALATKAKQLKDQGVNVLNLSVGEPDFDTFDNIKEAAIRAINAGKTKYTPVGGIPELKDAIIETYKSRLSCVKENIIVSNGAKQAIYNALLATVNENDEVIIPSPYWVSYPDMVKIARGNPVIVDCGIDTNFKITPELLEGAITTRTKWLFLNSPNNPTGMKYTKDELKSLVEVLKKYPNLYVMSDDIYEMLSYEDEPYSLVDFAEPIKDRLLVVNGVSKSYSMTGWRIGYSIGPAELIKAMSVIQSQSTTSACSISQYAALEALSGTQQYLEDSIEVFKSKRNAAYSFLNNIDGIECVKSEGAFYLFPQCSEMFGKKTPDGNLITNSSEFCVYLLQEALVAVVPGSAFGAEGYFRLSYAVSEEALADAANRIKEAVAKLK